MKLRKPTCGSIASRSASPLSSFRKVWHQGSARPASRTSRTNSMQQSGVAGAGFTITGQAGLRSNLSAQGSGQIRVPSVEAVVGGGVGNVEILIAHIPAQVIIGDSQIIARVLRGRVA